MHNIVPLLTLRPWRNSPRSNSNFDSKVQQTCDLEMHCIPDDGTINHTAGALEVNRRFVPEPTVKSNVGTRSNRLIERRGVSLDLEAAFKQIQISRDIEKQVCKECKFEFCQCPAFTPGTLCSSASSTPISTSDEQIPELVENKPVQQFHLRVQTPSDEEAD